MSAKFKCSEVSETKAWSQCEDTMEAQENSVRVGIFYCLRHTTLVWDVAFTSCLWDGYFFSMLSTQLKLWRIKLHPLFIVIGVVPKFWLKTIAENIFPSWCKTVHHPIKNFKKSRVSSFSLMRLYVNEMHSPKHSWEEKERGGGKGKFMFSTKPYWSMINTPISHQFLHGHLCIPWALPASAFHEIFDLSWGNYFCTSQTGA